MNSDYDGFTNAETSSLAYTLEHCEDIQDIIAGCKSFIEAAKKLIEADYEANGWGVRLDNANLNIMQLDRVIRDIAGI